VKKDAAPLGDTTTSASTTTTVADQSVPVAQGVKPSNETAHDTHAEAQSNQTKQYGNGQTAGQIAIKNGASGKTALHGPGNSQPHKAAPCAGGHEVDVHALKGRRAGSCGGGATTPDPSRPRPGHNDTPAVLGNHDRADAVGRLAISPMRQANQPRDGIVVERAQANAGHSARRSESAGCVVLPFTGKSLGPLSCWNGLIAAGLGPANGTVGAGQPSEHDHTDRARHAARSTRPPVGGGPADNAARRCRRNERSLASAARRGGESGHARRC
jgi:hypothetical protein